MGVKIAFNSLLYPNYYAKSYTKPAFCVYFQ